ncbi:hypothetical protein CEP54_012430 [Fusarium duplospermum]|uniref:Enoyl reductase (ER) domain-containing protein n=1 Tax=Fusarium duplospermum TaxID=1325734 RepID=A0A428P8S5_9HYPO|nr:hypothetical protein CEP54_012430 [Fusarium duplospermum]
MQISPGAENVEIADDKANLNPKSFMLPNKGISITPRAEQPSSWTQDLGLMSHYSSITPATLPGANLHVWQMEIPSVAAAYPFLMHQILAVSAFHLASLLTSLLQRLPRITESFDTKLDPVVKALVEEAIFALGESVGRASTASPELNVAIIWPMTLKDEFLDLIRAHHPAALVVVAHYCTVLDAVGSKFWVLENWGHRLLTAIVEALGPSWQYTAIKDTLESSLTLNENATPPDAQSLPKGHVLVQFITAAVNHVEYKLPEAPLYGKFVVQPPASPGLDFCGRIKVINDTDGSLKEGQLVFGALGITSKFPKFGTLGQVIVAPVSQLTVLPAAVAPDDTAAVGTAGMTAYQSLPQGLITPGTNIFINGGSGGVGSFTVQFAKALGATVTTTCSTADIQLCRSLGADEVIDYRKLDVIDELKKKGQIFDLAIDNVGTPAGMYEQSQHLLKPSGTFVQVAMQQSLCVMLRRSLLPSFLGGGKRQYRLVRVNINRTDLRQVGQWMAEGKVRAVIDHKFEWEDAPKSYEKLRLGRTVGKIVVHDGHA